ncbi:hypothetical protein [Diaminobutyricibacter sp. McL0608]|uniref:hypothetical protein n=1 Tax=Leifsonia sp. McL0608 TaxID=3143537 RepID=UPI0031F305A8
MKSARIAIASVASALLVATLGGCSALQSLSPSVSSDIFASKSDFTTAATAAFGSPGWLPDDATTIRVDFQTNGSDAILTYTSKKHFAPGTCTASAPVPKPPIQDSWWPVDTVAKTAVSCTGGWRAFVIGDQVYAAKGQPS